MKQVEQRVSVPLLMMATTVAMAAGTGAATGEELVNASLGDEYSHWMLGGISYMLSKKEIKTFMSLSSDERAATFVDAFWADQGSDLRARYEERAEQADELFPEDGLAGRSSDRGGLHIVYGPPSSVEPDAGNSSVTLWLYPVAADKGLDGKRPKRIYRFAEHEGRMLFYVAGKDEFANERRVINSVPRARPPQP